ncbi:MAG: hypothetical protein ACD_14C00033G0003 [uncultured bacterium]|nr:MAG: hypothetical protein ACD_14C00033G0003 [uncultured bacterium]KKQ46418.1 MAG: Phenylalanine-tRNA ligase beta subunit [Candidatus Moranbacteria bacterium GW2011_GWC2_37_8]KKQ62741.1 MAG: phenylalanyl-tRNA synthetase subunit beta, phenylalanyl-tRNA synthetase beta chain [Parcubacteria group bacterium GW2011_GWC1_38_22]
MKYSYNWLKELSGSKKSAEEIAEEITMHSFEVEEIEKDELKLDGVVVGEILEIEKHPNADKLQVTKVNIGKEVLQIVCGAHNISIGDKVPVATIGTTLPGDFKIKEAEIRSVKSFGMLCALDELGLGADHSGIFLLDKNVEIGTPLVDVLSEKDKTLEIKILPDRAHDAMSHVGMAREIAALEGNIIDYDFDGLILPRKKTNRLSVEIKDPEICSRYIGVVMTDVEIKDSPEWMKERLETCGIRPINNVVDATNLVMLEIGQPLHAFDFEQISENEKTKIVIRKAQSEEKIILLDESEKQLSSEDIVISNEKEILALAGVMGGLHSGISNKTRAIVLEAATFNATSVRKTRTSLNMVTEAALRFEKEIDPNLAEKAIVRLIEILEHTANGELEGIVDLYPKPVSPWTVELDLNYLNNLLGMEVPSSKCSRILESLDIKVKIKKNILIAKIPTYRIDLKTQENLIEEIGRVYGYENILAKSPLVNLSGATVNENRKFARDIKDLLASIGFNEVYNYSFYSYAEANVAGLDSIKHLELEAPMTADHAILRTSLIPGILKNVRDNIKNYKEFNIFEIGRIYFPSLQDALPEEKSILVGAIVTEKKGAKEEKIDKRHGSVFFEAKSHVDYLLEQIGINDRYYDTFEGSSIETPSLWHQSRSAEIKIEGSQESIGFVGEINPFVLEEFDINNRVAIFEFDMEKLCAIAEAEREFTPIRKHPVVIRDISLIASGNVRVDDILMVIQKAGGDLVLDVDMFDAIDFADSTTSFAFHVILGASERTLNGKEIDDVMNLITSKLESELELKMRR